MEREGNENITEDEQDGEFHYQTINFLGWSNNTGTRDVNTPGPELWARRELRM